MTTLSGASIACNFSNLLSRMTNSNSGTALPAYDFSGRSCHLPLIANAQRKFQLFAYTFSLKSHYRKAVVLKSARFPGLAFAAEVTEQSIYDFTVEDIDGSEVALSKFKGKVLLAVNVASRCGLTSSNYTELSHVYEKYKTQGFEILAFPCNQFGGQEPGKNAEIKEFACTRFKAEFPIFDKVDVNGPNTAPVYNFLKSRKGGILGQLIKWNFEKFLIDRNGKVVERYPPTTSPFQIEKDIQKLLAA